MTDGEYDGERSAISPGTEAAAAVPPLTFRRVSWGGIFAGGFITLAVWIMLTLLGALGGAIGKRSPPSGIGWRSR